MVSISAFFPDTRIIPYPIMVVPGSIPIIIFSDLIAVLLAIPKSNQLNVQKRVWYKILQVAIVLLAFLFLYSKLEDDFSWDFLNEVNHPEMLVWILLLLPLNIGLETVKWWKLTRKFAQHSFGKAFQSILLGSFYTLFTPNRIGDGAGRVQLLPPGNKTRGTFAFINGSMSQFLCTIVFGGFALAIIQQWYSPLDSEWWPYAQWVRWPIWIGTILLLLLYIEPGWVTMAKDLTKEDSWIGKRVRTLQQYSRRQNAGTLFLSAFRYGVFASQFYLALTLFGLEGSTFEVYLRIGILYLATTLIPTASLAELGIRESFAILIFPAAGISEEGAMAATLLLWVINLLIPALAGGILFLKVKPSST